jgi:hypothetical protein
MACTTAQREETLSNSVRKHYKRCRSGHHRGSNCGLVLHEGQEDMKDITMDESTITKAGVMTAEMSAIEATNLAS